MSWFSDEGEVFGTDVLNLAVVAGALFIVLATLWAPAVPATQAVAQTQPIEQIVVVAHPSHAS
jgi:hypothetical protein